MSGLASVGSEGAEEQAFRRVGRPGEPLVAGAGGLDAEVGAVAGHRDDHRRPRDVASGIGGQLARGHPQVEEEVVVAGDEPRRLGDVGRRGARVDQVGQQLAQEHQRPGAVAVVALVAHLQHLRDDRPDVDRLAGTNGVLQQWAEHVAHPVQPVDDLRAVCAVAQHLAEALVQGAPGGVVVGLVAQAEHPHRRRDDSGHRPDGTSAVARLPADTVTGRQHPFGRLGRRGEALEEHRADQRARASARTLVPSRPAGRRAGTARASGRALRRPAVRRRDEPPRRASPRVPARSLRDVAGHPSRPPLTPGHQRVAATVRRRRPRPAGRGRRPASTRRQ